MRRPRWLRGLSAAPDTSNPIGINKGSSTLDHIEAWEYFMPREQPSDTAFADGTPGFSGRFVGTFEDGGNTIVGRVQLSYDDESWQDDLQTTYHRMSARRD